MKDTAQERSWFYWRDRYMESINDADLEAWAKAAFLSGARLERTRLPTRNIEGYDAH